ncbi:MAG: histidine phosphatase family protein [Acidobacteriota bacterium]
MSHRRPDARRLVFETHATSLDNEAGVASGHFDVDLSPAGEAQAVALGERYRADPPALVAASDLRRAWRTAELAFGSSVPIVRDARLRECDYGELTRQPTTAIDAVRPAAIDRPFPGGESYRQAVARVGGWLDELRAAWPSGWVLVIGHRATHYALDHLIHGAPIADLMTAPFAWQPGWSYDLDG